MKAILRAQRYFSTPELVRLYKAQVLSYIESGTPGFFHAAALILDCINKIQRRFLRAVGLSEESALLGYRLAPLQTRRCIGILGFLHRVVLGQVSAQISDLFPMAPEIAFPDNISARARGGVCARHTKQLVDRIQASSNDKFRHSIFGMVQCYNSLPQTALDQPTVSLFQRSLQVALSRHAESRLINWQDIFSDGRRYSFILRFQALFRGHFRLPYRT